MKKRQYARNPAPDTSVMSAGNLFQTRPFQADNNNQQAPQVQQKSEELTGGFDLTKMQYTFNPPTTVVGQPLQAKLKIDEPNDKYEQEADRVAGQVVQHIHAGGGAENKQNAIGQGQNELPGETAQSSLQRVNEPIGEEALQAKPLHRLQRRTNEGGIASTELEQGINLARGGGQSLAPNFQAQIGQAMGADFSGVKIHTDAQADQLSRSMSARAFTTGQDVFFKEGEYQPQSRSGQELIAHELTHVVQQNDSEIRTQEIIQRTGGGDGEEKKVVAQGPPLAAAPPPPPPLRQNQKLTTKGTKSELKLPKSRNYKEKPVEKSELRLPKSRNYKEKPVKNKEGAKNYAGPTSGVEIEHPVMGWQVQYPKETLANSDPVFARVMHEQQTVCELTRDLGSNPFTIEIRTTPVVETDQDGKNKRLDGLQLANWAIDTAGRAESGVKKAKNGDLILQVVSPHTIVDNKKLKNPGWQVTYGRNLDNLLTEVTKEGKGIFQQATWMKNYSDRVSEFKKETVSESGVTDKGALVYAMLIGLIETLVRVYVTQRPREDRTARRKEVESRQDDEKKPWLTDKGYGSEAIEKDQRSKWDVPKLWNLSMEPFNVKNMFGVLPKTPPKEWLNALESTDSRVVTKLVEIPPSDFHAGTWKAAKEKVLGGSILGGKSVPKFFIAGKTGHAFEVRSPTKEMKEPYVKSAK
ncbi:MAG: eCIS core domain-containing protein [Thainema sp.]